MAAVAPRGQKAKEGGTAGAPRGRRGRSNIVWDTNCYAKSSLPTYNALHDANLRTHYEKRGVRQQLFHASHIDRVGRILNGNTTKLNIIQQEFANAERDEAIRLRDEEYERRKLDARKTYMRQYLEKVDKYRSTREQAATRRQAYANKYFSFLPSGTGSLSAAPGPNAAAEASARSGRERGRERERQGSGAAASAAGSGKPQSARAATGGPPRATAGSGAAAGAGRRRGDSASDSDRSSSASSRRSAGSSGSGKRSSSGGSRRSGSGGPDAASPRSGSGSGSEYLFLHPIPT